jgi:hypothetical protein
MLEELSHHLHHLCLGCYQLLHCIIVVVVIVVVGIIVAGVGSAGRHLRFSKDKNKMDRY